MPFWTDGNNNCSRTRNAQFTSRQIKKLSSFLCDKGMECSYRVYDFSPSQIILDSIHIPYPPKAFEKSKKINKILQDLANENCDFIIFMDSDLFIAPEDYDSFLDIAINLQKNQIALFDLAKLGEDDTAKIAKEEKVSFKSLHYSYAYSGKKEYGPLKGSVGGLGGLFIAPVKLLLSVGGYDEKFKGWGGEDNDLLTRLLNQKKLTIKNTKSIKSFAPYHLNHLRDLSNPLYAKRFS
jgi:predicted glycosyltransferase involved in capsule biosynthesis